MQPDLLSIIDEDIEILRETLCNFERMKDSNPVKNEFAGHTKKDIQWMLALRKKYVIDKR